MTQTVPFTEKDQELLTQLADLYQQIKPIILYAEELDEESNANLQVMKELRDAFDHLMRVVAFNTNLLPEKSNDPDYAPANLRAARSHLLRASFDALDGLIHTLKQQIIQELRPFDTRTILDVVKNYPEIRRNIAEISENIAKYRQKKDAGDLVLTVELIEGYLKDTDLLKSYHHQILGCLDVLKQHQQEKKKDKHNNFIFTIVSTIIASVVSAWITYVLSTSDKKPQTTTPPTKSSTAYKAATANLSASSPSENKSAAPSSDSSSFPIK